MNNLRVYDMQQNFQTGLCDVCSAGEMMCLCSFIGCYPTAATRTMYDRSNYLLNCCCIFGFVHRNIIREGYNIKGNCVDDILIHTFCNPCSNIQLYTEVKRRGPLQRPDLGRGPVRQSM